MGNISNVELITLEKVFRKKATLGNILVKGWEQVSTSMRPYWKLKCYQGESFIQNLT